MRVGSSVIPRVDSYKYLIKNHGNERKKALFLRLVRLCLFFVYQKMAVSAAVVARYTSHLS